MGRRAIVVIVVGLVATIGVFIAATAADYSDFDAKATVPKLIAGFGIALTTVAAILVILGDIDERRALARAERMNIELQEREHDLVQSNRELERFATIAAHDLQEPLRTILTYSELIERRFSDTMEGEALGYLLRVAAAASRMRALIEDLLIYARIGQAERQYEIVDLNEVIKAAMDNADNLIIETEADIEIGELPTVRGNEPGLTQLFTNLLANAMKYRVVAPIVQVSAQRKKDEWLISVSDNGKGIDPQHHEKIFELFRRLEPGDGAKGTGLGLAICARVVDAHGGRIWVKSTVGQGATFSFTLPLLSERPAGRPGGRRAQRAERGA